MFLPYTTTLSLWFSASSVYRWEPLATPAVPADSEAAAVAPEPSAEGDVASPSLACGPAGLPAMRLVFRGVKWTAYPVFGMRENLAWQQVSDTRREEDEQRNADNLRQGLKPPPGVPDTKTDS